MSDTTKYEWTAKNDNQTERLDVIAADHGENYKKVSLRQIEGSMLFVFTMTPAQARQMAMALIAAAESLA